MTGLADHGTLRRYGAGCSCRPCKAAMAAWKRERVKTLGAAVEAGTIDPPHDLNGYQNYGCRCTTCCTANTAATAAARAERAAALRADPRLAIHGLYTTYTNWGCRCTPCRAAQARYRVDYRRRKAQAS